MTMIKILWSGNKRSETEGPVGASEGLGKSPEEYVQLPEKRYLEAVGIQEKSQFGFLTLGKLLNLLMPQFPHL